MCACDCAERRRAPSSDAHKFCRNVIDPIVSGIEPVSAFSSMYRFLSCASAPMPGGIVPVRPLRFK